MARGQFGPTGYGFFPVKVRVLDGTGDPLPTYSASGAEAPPNIDGTGRVSFWIEAGDYTLELTHPETLEVETHAVTVTAAVFPAAPSDLPLPTPTTGDAGKVVTVTGTEDGYELDTPSSGGSPVPGVYGDGSDGAVVLNGTSTFAFATLLAGAVYSLTRDLYATDLTVDAGVTLFNKNFRVYVTGTLTNNGTLQSTPISAAPPSSGVLPASPGGGAGLTGGGGAGGTGSVPSVGGNGGNGGAGGTGAGGNGGTATPASAGGVAAFRNLASVLSLSVMQAGLYSVMHAGGGGGGGGGDGTHPGGNGGIPGGVLPIYAKIIANNGVLRADGQDGNSPTLGGNTGGGGGGGAGAVVVLSTSPQNGTVTALGGAGAAGAGTGVAGAAGQAGNIIWLSP